MTQGQTLYLLLVLASFGVFMATLAWIVSRYTPRPRTLPAAASDALPHDDHAAAH